MARSLLDWFRSPEGKQRLVDELKAQPLIQEQEDLANKIARDIKLEAVGRGAVLIEQGASDSDLFLILRGVFSVTIDGRVVARLGAGQHVGEMAALTDSRRSATVVAMEDAVVARVGKGEFFALAGRFPDLWRRVATQLVARLSSSSAGESSHGKRSDRITKPPAHQLLMRITGSRPCKTQVDATISASQKPSRPSLTS